MQIAPELIAETLNGDLAETNALVRVLRDPLYRFALRNLGHREDAEDATQDIILRILTRLSTYRAESRFSTWAYAIAAHHIADLQRVKRRRPVQSLEEKAEMLDALVAGAPDAPVSDTPEDALHVREVELACTQGMLMGLDVEQRMAFLLAEVFDVDAARAARILGISEANYRQRVSRARKALQGFVTGRCSVFAPGGSCRCSTVARCAPPPANGLATHPADPAPERALAEIRRLSKLARLFRRHPDYIGPETINAAIAEALRGSAFAAEKPFRSH